LCLVWRDIKLLRQSFWSPLRAEQRHVQCIVLDNKAEAARVLGIAHTTRYRKVQE
jgi:hypothetical protein